MTGEAHSDVAGGTPPATGLPQVRLLHVADCPLVDRVRTALQDVLHSTGIRAVVEDIEGLYPSPTLLVDGVDIVTGRAPGTEPCCRLDLPTREQISTALRGGARQ